MSNLPNILVIDDDDIYQYLTRKALEKTNLVKNVYSFSDGKKALAFFEENASNKNELPDIIFLDLNMPILNGWSFIEELRKLKLSNSSNMQVYVVSSSFDNRDVEKSKEFPEVIDYLIKPVSKSQIIEIITKN